MTSVPFDRIAAAAVISLAILAAPLGAAAQTSTPASPAASPPAATTAKPAKAKASPAERVETRIKNLHASLMITPDQEADWNNVAQAMRDDAKEIEQLARARRAKRSTMTAVDDLRSYEAIADAHADGLKKLVPAFDALYDKMSDAQKKNADAVFAHRSRSTAPKKS
jgi:periplasmic protein CpxP/Spy